jgi:class 3 adenylate cyclase
MCTLFAATYPEKTIALVMIGSYARRLRGEGYPWGPTLDERSAFFAEIRAHWGGPVGLAERAPSKASDAHFREWWAAYLRHGASPSAALALTKMNTEIDIRKVLPSVQVPTLVLHRSGDACLEVDEGRFLATQIPGARFVELPGVDHLPFVGDQDAILDTIEEFLTGMRPVPEFDRVLATVVAARISGYTKELSAAEQSTLVDRYRAFVQRDSGAFHGRTVQMTGPRLLAAFDGPARAIRAACALSDAAKKLGLSLRVGLHTGECHAGDGRVRGVAADVASEVAERGAGGDVIVSGTVRDLVAGAGIRFIDRGQQIVSGLGELRVFAVERGAAG